MSVCVSVLFVCALGKEECHRERLVYAISWVRLKISCVCVCVCERKRVYVALGA